MHASAASSSENHNTATLGFWILVHIWEFIVIASEEYELHKVCGEIYDSVLCVSRISDIHLQEPIAEFNFLLPQKTYLELYEIGSSDGSGYIGYITPILDSYQCFGGTNSFLPQGIVKIQTASEMLAVVSKTIHCHIPADSNVHTLNCYGMDFTN
jgi:hypothetical protein